MGKGAALRLSPCMRARGRLTGHRSSRLHRQAWPSPLQLLGINSRGGSGKRAELKEAGSTEEMAASRRIVSGRLLLFPCFMPASCRLATGELLLRDAAVGPWVLAFGQSS